MVRGPHDLQGFDELTERDVLRVDPIHEYERREVLRRAAEERLAASGDENDELVAQGRPTGP